MASSKVQWSSPSNIAVVKYWGKYGNQMPRNTSISLTLSECKSITSLEWATKKKSGGDLAIDFYFEGKKNDAFGEKTRKFLNENLYLMPFLRYYSLQISTENTFPHSAGIASSASGMSALALCLMDMARSEGIKIDVTGSTFTQHASVLARLGSGSACRSLFEGAAVWGHHPQIEDSSDQYAIGLGERLNDVFWGYHDDIVIISDEEKSVSSSAGHALMSNNPFADLRFSIAQQNAFKLMQAMQFGDVKTFGEILEEEALMLHALMMTSHPSYILMKGGTLQVIESLRKFRHETSLPVYFTLDAGPNVHILYPDTCKSQVASFLDEFVNNRFQVISDKVGEGPQKLQ